MIEKHEFDEPVYIRVTLTKSRDEEDADRHADVVALGFPSSGCLILMYAQGGVHTYAPGTWVDFFSYTDND